MSKGSKSRIQDQAKFNKGFDKIFNKEPGIPELNVEWQCYCNKINEIRESYCLDSKVFTENDQERFAKAHKKKYNI
jgi:hypothetical protein